MIKQNMIEASINKKNQRFINKTLITITVKTTTLKFERMGKKNSDRLEKFKKVNEKISKILKQ